MNEIKLGDIVVSLKGRDAENLYIVSKIEDDYVFLVDGKGKTINKPKKKKIKHVEQLNKNCEVLAEKFTKNKTVLDAEVRKYIRNSQIS